MIPLKWSYNVGNNFLRYLEDHGENEQTKAYAIKYAFKEQYSFLPSMSKADGPETFMSSRVG